MKRTGKAGAACAAALIALAGCAVVGGQGGATVTVLSSPPELVSGGDARIEVKAAQGALGALAFRLNGRPIEPAMRGDAGRVEGVVSGLAAGSNRLEVSGAFGSETLTLTSHPSSGPMFSGPQQNPFICRSYESGLGQPLVDNQDGAGHPVYDPVSGQLAGYSKWCGIAPRVDYFYFNGSAFKPYSPGGAAPPADMSTITVKGASAPFIVRLEGGSINRFLYTIATLAPAAGAFEEQMWNRKLIYWLRGGVGIGHQQGTAMWFKEALNSSERQFMPRVLAQGYAVVSSTGNETGVHYNMRLAEETALMTKEHFIKAYGMPRYTIGVGGSGGAVQQYLFAQNRPGLLDGGIPIQSYPDMVTQTIPVSDCPLLGQYFRDEVAANAASPWAVWSRQRLVEGMNASDTVRNPVTGTAGSTECISGWRMALPTVLNPVYKDKRFDVAAAAYRYPADVFAPVKWTHWNDLANYYGTDRLGHAPSPIDNVGVQYGLAALAQGQLDADEFLRINACAGGWKEPAAYADWDAAADPFDARNMLRSASCGDPGGVPAARRAGSGDAIRSAFSSGHVFTGRRLGMPVIDLRPYLEPALDMHNARQSFAVRARLLHANPALVARQVIWVTGANAKLVDSALDALAVMESYLEQGAPPPGFVDKCLDAAGAPIASGPTAWDGALDGKAKGACAAAYPVYSSPRMVAGESIRGDTFKCALKPLATALRDGTYPAGVQFTAQQQAWLGRIFPQGVCDYRQPGQFSPVE